MLGVYADFAENWMAMPVIQGEKTAGERFPGAGHEEGGGVVVTRSALEVNGVVPGLDQNAFQQAAEDAEKGCPISNAIRGNLEITVKATLDS